MEAFDCLSCALQSVLATNICTFYPNGWPTYYLLPSSLLLLPLTSVLQTSSHRSQPCSIPPLSASKNNAICSQTTVDRETQLVTDAEGCGVEEEIRALSPTGNLLVIQRRLLDKESDGSCWSWTVGDNSYTAQWVKHKQEYRSTRPW